MIVNFRIKNHLSIVGDNTLSMLASSGKKEVDELRQNAIIKLENNINLLPVATIYGANASGKSNVIDSINIFKNLVLGNFQDSGIPILPVEPFRLEVESEKEPSLFEITFFHNKKFFRYGIELSMVQIFREWLFEKENKPRAKEKQIFLRENEKLISHAELFKIGKIILKQNLVKQQVPMLTLANQLNDEKAKEVFSWFRNLNIIDAHHDELFQSYSKHMLANTEMSKEMANLVSKADLDIQKLGLAEYRSKQNPEEVEQEVVTQHKKYNRKHEEAGFATFMLNKHESEGTRKLFNLSGPIIDTIKNGRVLVIDEMDSKIHPNLLQRIVLLFQNPKINTKGAQLIFVTHDTNLLGADILRRDQIWFTEKDNFGATKLYPLTEYAVRNKEAIEKNYIEGKYGAVPSLGNFDNYLEEAAAKYGKEK